jgi:hypothetical protein
MEPIFSLHFHIPPSSLADLSIPQIADHLEYLATVREAENGR